MDELTCMSAQIGAVALRRVVMAVVLVLVAGCGDSADQTTDAAILPHQSPASFGEMYPRGNHDPDLASTLRTPYEWVLLLQSTGNGTLEINQACLVGDGGAGSQVGPFTLEVENQTLPATVEHGADFGVRVTYDRQEPNKGDDIDQVAVVIQSNAKNFPTLIVPVCSRVVADGEPTDTVACQSPVEVPAGTRDSTLCK